MIKKEGELKMVGEGIFPEAILKLRDSITKMFSVIEDISKNPILEIDPSEFEPAQYEILKNIDEEIKRQELNYWCIDEDVLNHFYDVQEINDSNLTDYVQEHLDEIIHSLLEEPLFQLHESLIKETEEAFKNKYYKLCLFPLFTLFEQVIVSWYYNQLESGAPQKTKTKDRNFKNKITVDENIEEDILIIFARSIVRMYKKTFDKFGNEPSKGLQRNAMFHGYYFYDEIGKRHILQLFQLLKASTVLKFVDKKFVLKSN